MKFVCQVFLTALFLFFLSPQDSRSAEVAKPINHAMRKLLAEAIDSDDRITAATAQATLQTLLEGDALIERDPMVVRGLLSFLTSEILSESPRLKKIEAAPAGWGLLAEPTPTVPPVIQKLVTVDPRLAFTAFLAMERTRRGHYGFHRSSALAPGVRCENAFAPVSARAE